MLVEAVERQTIDALIEELDARAAQDGFANGEGRWACRRQEPRYPFRAACKVRGSSIDAAGPGSLTGQTRNVSRHGLGLLIRGVFSTGEVIEVQITPPGQPPVYMAGVVRYCRYAGNGYREIGMRLLAARPERILCGQAGMPKELLDRLRGQ